MKRVLYLTERPQDDAQAQAIARALAQKFADTRAEGKDVLDGAVVGTMPIGVNVSVVPWMGEDLTSATIGKLLVDSQDSLCVLGWSSRLEREGKALQDWLETGFSLPINYAVIEEAQPDAGSFAGRIFFVEPIAGVRP